ncbi:Uncharacterised protein [Bordetella pertussis]|nr:Uncharacterised protein [Bordetella pertussis]
MCLRYSTPKPRSNLGGGACQAALRAASSSSEISTSMRRPGTSSAIRSPLRTSASGPPT